jgi:hypothetical protein
MDPMSCTPDMVNPIEKTIKRPNHSRLDLAMCSDGNNYVLRAAASSDDILRDLFHPQ